MKLFEDSKGRICAGCENAGLNVYDKHSGKFHRIAHQEQNPSSLSGNSIRTIAELGDGRMLVATEGAGLNIIQLSADFFEKDAPPLISKLALPLNAQVYGMGKD